MLTVVVPVPAPILIVVAAPAKLTVVGVVLTRLNVALGLVILELILGLVVVNIPAIVVFPVEWATVNLFVLIAKSLPIPTVPKILVLPVALSTWNVVVIPPLLIVKYSLAGVELPDNVKPLYAVTPWVTCKVPDITVLPVELSTVNLVEFTDKLLSISKVLLNVTAPEILNVPAA